MWWEMGEPVDCFQIFEELPHEGGNHCVLLRGSKTSEKYREADFGRLPEEFRCLSPNVASILTLGLMK